MKFLFALDDPVAETLLESILEGSGHEIVIVSTAAELEEELPSCAWDGFFLSLRFPEISRFLEEIGSPAFTGRPFVVLIAVKRTGASPLPTAQPVVADAVLEPPIDAWRVSEVLEKIIERRWQASPPKDAADGEIEAMRHALQNIPPDLLHGIKRAFGAETAVHVEGLADACVREDVKSIKFACHKIAGSSLTIGARGLGELCRFVECSPDRKIPVLALELLPRIREQFERAKGNLDAALETMKGHG